MIKKLLAKLTKKVTVALATVILIAMSIGAKRVYDSHAPIEPTGSCIIYRVDKAIGSDQIALSIGKVISHDYKEGTVTLLTKVMFFEVPFQVPVSELRGQGYIRVGCDE